MNASTPRLALRMLLRDWRAGELNVLIAALVIAVASVGTVGFFTDRVKGALSRQANLLLGADVLISGDKPLPPLFTAEALKRGLAFTNGLRFNSMVSRVATPGEAESGAANAMLADVKGVGPNYPLRGGIHLVDPAQPDGTIAKGIPPRGEVWPDTRLGDRLGLKIGDALAIGDSTLRVSAFVAREPELPGGLFSMGPRLLVNIDDVPATNLLQPGNRATYRLFVADLGNRGALDAYTALMKGELQAGQRLENVRDIRPELRQTLDRAEEYLGLAALAAVILAAVAVALATSRYLRRHIDTAAMMRCLGAPERTTLAIFVVQFAALGFIASVAGIVIASIGQHLLTMLLGTITTAPLPAPTIMPALMAFGIGMLLLFGFALPPLVALAGVPPLRVLRRDLPRPNAGSAVAYVLGAAVIALLIAMHASTVKVAAIVVGGVAGLLVASALSAWALIALLKRVPQRGVTWRYGLANLRRRPLASSLQVGALALGFMALLLLTVVRGDLLRNWRASVPPDAPNYFLINVMPDQLDGVRTLVQRESGVDAPFYPMIRGRLTAVNGAPLDTTQFASPQARRLAEREFNLSWSREIPLTNRVVAGKWWDDATGAAAGLSLEEGIAHLLGIKLGDELTYDVAGTKIAARVTSLRKVDWNTFRPNFFALVAPGVLESMPRTYLGGLRIPEGPRGATWLRALVQQYPNVLAIDVGELLRQIQSIIDQVAKAVEFVFLFTLLGGLLVLQSAIASTQDERKFDAAVLRTLGASQGQLTTAQVAEFLMIGALSGLLAATGAMAVAYYLSDRVFQIPFSANPVVWLYGIAGGAICVTLAGWLGTRDTVREPPLEVMRQLG